MSKPQQQHNTDLQLKKWLKKYQKWLSVICLSRIFWPNLDPYSWKRGSHNYHDSRLFMISLNLQPINTFFQCLFKWLQQKKKFEWGCKGNPAKSSSSVSCKNNRGCAPAQWKSVKEMIKGKPRRETTSVNSRLSNTFVHNKRLSVPMHAERSISTGVHCQS